MQKTVLFSLPRKGGVKNFRLFSLLSYVRHGLDIMGKMYVIETHSVLDFGSTVGVGECKTDKELPTKTRRRLHIKIKADAD